MLHSLLIIKKIAQHFWWANTVRHGLYWPTLNFNPFWPELLSTSSFFHLCFNQLIDHKMCSECVAWSNWSLGGCYWWCYIYIWASKPEKSRVHNFLLLTYWILILFYAEKHPTRDFSVLSRRNPQRISEGFRLSVSV